MLGHIFEVLVQGSASYTFYRQIAMDTGFAFLEDALLPAVHAKLVEWIHDEKDKTK
jgi:hypothetical protein